MAGIKNKNVTFGFNFDFDYDAKEYIVTDDDDSKILRDNHYIKSKFLMKSTLDLMKSKDLENEILRFM